MTDFLTVDVIDRPASGTVRAFAALLRGSRPIGCRGLVPCTTLRFVTRLRPSFTPRRLALIVAWDDEDAADRAWAAGGALGRLGHGAAERWHVRGPLAFGAPDGDDWHGWTPQPEGTRRADFDGPVLALISGELRTTQTLKFMRDNVEVVRQAERHPGYLGGLGLASSPANTTSCSAWRSAAAMRDFAFAAGAHREAYKVDLEEERHVTQRFLRMRPTATTGTVDGRQPFAGLLGAPGAAVAA